MKIKKKCNYVVVFAWINFEKYQNNDTNVLFANKRNIFKSILIGTSLLYCSLLRELSQWTQNCGMCGRKIGIKGECSVIIGRYRYTWMLGKYNIVLGKNDLRK